MRLNAETPRIVDCRLMIDGVAARRRKSHKAPVVVIPANAEIQENHPAAAGLDSRVRGSDGLGDFLRDHQLFSIDNHQSTIINPKGETYVVLY
jgi:hypothetical protein